MTLFHLWNLPGDVLAAPESASGLDRCNISLSLSQWTIGTMISTHVTIHHHLISQVAGIDVIYLSIYLESRSQITDASLAGFLGSYVCV